MKKLIRDKRGLELAINIMVILILAVVLLIVLVFAFTQRSSEFMSTIKSYFSYSNVDSAVKGCNVLVDTNSQYVFCCEKKNVKYYENDKRAEGSFSCNELKEKDFISDLKSLDCTGVNCDLGGRNSGSSGGVVLNKETCEKARGKWNDCGSICGIMNQGNPDIFCTAVCDEICECGGIAGFGCPPGYECTMPEGIADARGYCK